MKNISFAAAMLIAFLFFKDKVSGQANDGNIPWIKMMDDPNTNYYEAVDSYNEYWKSHTKPVMEEEEEMTEGENAGERKRELNKEIKKDRNVVLTDEQARKKNEDEVMKYNIKRFEQWMREMKPFVKEDGRIMSDEERKQMLINQQQDFKK